MSVAYNLLATPENIEKALGWGYSLSDKGSTGCTQCSDCDRFVHYSRIFWSGGGESQEYDPHCLKCVMEYIELMEDYVDERLLEMENK